MFDKSLYTHDRMFIFECAPGISGYLCVTFKVIGDGDQALLTNYKSPDPFRQFNEIVVSKSGIQILGYREKQPASIPIVHDCTVWSTLFIDYQVGESATMATWSVGGKTGDFTFDSPIMCESGVFIGGRDGGDRSFHGAIVSIECMYHATAQKIPDTLKELIINGQKVNT